MSGSAHEARDMQILSAADRVSMNQDHLLHDAKQLAASLYDSGYRPPARKSESHRRNRLCGITARSRPNETVGLFIRSRYEDCEEAGMLLPAEESRSARRFQKNIYSRLKEKF